MNPKPLNSAQIRAARSLIRWSAEDLAGRSSLSVETIRRAELTDSETSMTAANDLAVRRALDVAADHLRGRPALRSRRRRVHRRERRWTRSAHSRGRERKASEMNRSAA